MKRTFRRIVAGILMVAMILPITALAAEYNLSNGDIKIDVKDDGQYVTQTQDDTIIIDNKKDESTIVITQAENTTTSNTITVNAAGSTATVTIQDVNIEAEGKAAITTTGDVTIQVSGENHVSSETVKTETSGYTVEEGGIAIEAVGSLTITGAPETEKPAEEGDPFIPENSLTVEGDLAAIDVTGENSSDGELTIGNGDSNDETLGDIEVTAVGGEVGIDANVTVDDGYLNAWGDVYGNATDDGIGIDGNLIVEEGAAAVYGDDIGVDGNVTVNDGNVTIENDGLGGGNSAYDIGVLGNLTVNNGTVSVTNNNYGVGGNVTVTGGTVEVSNGPNTTEGDAIRGVLDVTGGNVTVYGYDAGVMEDVSVTGDGTASIHSYGSAVYGSIQSNGSLTLHDQNHKLDNCNHPACNQTMIFAKHDDGTFDIHGVYTFTDDAGNEKSVPHQTTCGNYGYETWLRVDGDAGRLNLQNGELFVFDAWYEPSPVDLGLNAQVELKPMKGGQLLQIVYTVTNTTDHDITFDLGSGADIQIGNDDRAVISPLSGNSGFKMVNSGNEAQFNFFGKGYQGVTSVDSFWYGDYYKEWSGEESHINCIFNEVSLTYERGNDAVATWCWLKENIEAHGVKTYSVLIGIGGADSENVAGGTTEGTTPDTTEPEPIPAPAAPSSQLTIKLDTVDKVIDLAASTQDGKPMEKLEATSELTSGKTLAPEDAIVVCKAETTADATVEDITKDDVAMAFTVAYLRKGVVSNLPSKAKISIPSPADSLEGYVLVFVLENGKQIEIPYELIDGKVIFTTDRVGLYMLVKK